MLSEYEQQRKSTIERNENYLKSLGIKVPKKRKVRDKVKSKSNVQRTGMRRSTRIKKENVELFELGRNHLGLNEQFSQQKNEIKNERFGPEDIDASMPSVQFKEVIKDEAPILNGDNTNYGLHEWDLQKITKKRIMGADFHPNSTKVVLACGDRVGGVGIWITSAEEAVKDSQLVLHHPHNQPVGSVLFDPKDTSKLVSSSYDGTLRCLDIQAGNKAKFEQIYALDDKDIRFIALTMDKEQRIYWVTRDDGCMQAIDPRMKNSIGVVALHEKKINTWEQYPKNTNYFVSASLDRTCAIWDMRKFQYQTDADDYTICERAHITSIPHRLSVNSASFSPSGNEMVTVSQDHLVSIFDASDVHHDSMKPMKNKFAIPHRNDTGKWVSKFTASWDPKDLNGRFIIGSKRQPRSTEVFSVHEKAPMFLLQDDELVKSIQSVNLFHPTLDIIATTNSSGKSSLWRAL